MKPLHLITLAALALLTLVLVINAGGANALAAPTGQMPMAPTPTPAPFATFVVNTTGDGDDISPGNGICETSNPGKCSLRAAIEEANAFGGANTIQFAIGSGVKTIKPGSALPTITERVIIDGTTQPNCATYPCIEIDGENAGSLADGLFIHADHVTIKGLVINRFGGGFGIHIRDSSSDKIKGNFIGTDVNGAAALPNYTGVLIEEYNGSATNDIVGGTKASARNVISGHSTDGVVIQGASVIANVVEGNYIGTDVSGKNALGNQQVGVHLIETGYNMIGGTSTGTRNVIAFNGDVGVRVCCTTNAVGNAIRGNSIHDNGGLGIDLGGDGFVTPNDDKDPDSGPNTYQNFPVLTSADVASQQIKGTLNSIPGKDFTLEFFSSAKCDASGNGEGNRILGKPLTVHTDPTTGNASFTYPATNNFLKNAKITATATDQNGNTSEFSQCIMAQ